MKAIITLHPNAGNDLSEVIVRKGKRLAVNQAENNTLVVSEDGQVLGIYPNVRSLELKGKPSPKENQNGYVTDPGTIVDQIAAAITRTDLSDHLKMCIAHGILKAEQLADEKSQARWAVESNPVATAHPDFDAFINSKMTSEDCALFGVEVARAERDANDRKIGELEKRLEELEADIDTDALPQAMQDREMLYGRITKLQELIGVHRESAHINEYFRGMLNGMLLSESVMIDQEPDYMKQPVAEAPKTTPAIIDPKAFEAIPAGAPEVEFADLDESNTPTVDKGGLKKK